MNNDDLNRIWNSPLNQPSPTRIEEEKMQFIRTLHRRHRGFVLFMSLVFTALIILTGVLLLEVISPDSAGRAIDWRREWSIVPLFALPWAAWIYAVTRYRRHRAAHPDYSASIQATARALLDENRVTLRRNRFIALLQIGFLALLPLMVHQLKEVGKAGDEINAMFILFPAVFGVVLAWMAYRCQRSLLPAKRRLESLLNSYQTRD